MRDNNRVRPQRYELSLDGKQAGALLVGALVILGGVFVIGMSVGRQAAGRAAAPVAATARSALDHLDEPLLARDEPAPELKAAQALTDARAIDKAMPVVPAKAAPPAQPPFADPVLEKTAPQIATSAPTAPTAPAASPTAPPTTTATPAPSAPPIPAPTATLTRTVPPTAGSSVKAAAAKAAPKGAYTIQVASSSSRADAERLAQKLAARRPRIAVADVAGRGRFYRVQIGTFESQEAARRQLAALARAGVAGIVTPAR